MNNTLISERIYKFRYLDALTLRTNYFRKSANLESLLIFRILRRHPELNGASLDAVESTTNPTCFSRVISPSEFICFLRFEYRPLNWTRRQYRTRGVRPATNLIGTWCPAELCNSRRKTHSTVIVFYVDGTGGVRGNWNGDLLRYFN